MNDTRQATLKTGWGYWDVTRYPYGGYFRRLTADTAVEILEEYAKRGETKVRFGDGRIGVIQTDAVLITVDVEVFG